MISAPRQFVLLVGKDLRIESRSRQTLGLVIVLGLLIIVVLGMGLGANGNLAGFNATAVLWVAYLFSGVLCFEKTFSVERADSCWRHHRWRRWIAESFTWRSSPATCS